MGRDISYIHAKTLAKTARDVNTFIVHVDERGSLSAGLDLDAKALGLKPGRHQQVRVVPYRTDVDNGTPLRLPVSLPHGRTCSITLGVAAEEGQDHVRVDVQATLPDLSDEWITLLVERAHPLKAPLLAAGIAALAVTAGLALATWGDPAARRGHYEGKTDEEIQADLDADVAWYAMEISVASAMTVHEGETTIAWRPSSGSSTASRARRVCGRGTRRQARAACRGRPRLPARRPALRQATVLRLR